MRLFSYRNRPVHLGPYPLERLRRADTMPDLAAVETWTPPKLPRAEALEDCRLPVLSDVNFPTGPGNEHLRVLMARSQDIFADSEINTIRRDLGVTGGSIIDELNGLAEPERRRRWAQMETIEATASEHAATAN